MKALLTDAFFDAAAELSAFAGSVRTHDFRGRWTHRNPWNVPGPIYVGEDDECGTGPMAAPNNFILISSEDERFVGSSLGSEFVYRQPTSRFELRRVVEAAHVHTMCEYAIDGNLHWNLEAIVSWWQMVRGLRATLRRNVNDWVERRVLGDVGPSADLWRWLDYLEHGVEHYLREYCYFVETGIVPREGEARLPTL